MTDRPIIFSGPMVKALLAGAKTQTRRPLREQPGELDQPFMMDDGSWHITAADGTNMSPLTVRYAVGDRLYVREAWAPLSALTHNDPGTLALAQNGFYRADNGTVDGEISRWKPSIHMPRWASRLILTITDVRVQRLQDISEEDAVAEGISVLPLQNAADPSAWWQSAPGENQARTPAASYAKLWSALHGPGAWASNPWIVAISFGVQHGNIDRIGGK